MNRALKEYQERAAQLERIKQRFEVLRDKLKKLTELGLKVEIRRNRMVIRLPGDVLFSSGDDKLRDNGVKVLDAVADVIRNDKQLAGRYFQIAGHTDNKPLKGGRFGDNWGLSAMRARQVLLYLIAPFPRLRRTRSPPSRAFRSTAAAASTPFAYMRPATVTPIRWAAMPPTPTANRTGASSSCCCRTSRRCST